MKKLSWFNERISSSMAWRQMFLFVPVVFLLTLVWAGGIWAGSSGQVAAGAGHTAVIKEDGTLWAWGRNDYVQLGDGTTVDKNSPVQIGVDADWQTVVAGHFHTVALKNDGSLWTWGSDVDGQLGDGKTKSYKDSPVQIGTDIWKDIAAGGNHTMAIKNDGTLWGWGRNSSGQIAGYSNSNGPRPSPVQIGKDSDWQDVSAGYSYNIVIKQDGSLWTWGKMDPYKSCCLISTPTRIGTNNDWKAVSAGDYHAIALKIDGSLWAWGQNSSGQLGDGTTEDKDNPTRIGMDRDWQEVAAGSNHAVAIKQNGSLWAWGSNGAGQLGDGTTEDKSRPTQIGTDHDWQAVAAGDYHTVALKADGSIWVWGNNSFGQIGDGRFGSQKNSYTQIGEDDNWRAVIADFYHAFALKNDDSLWGWGRNDQGQLGDGTKEDKSSPVQIGTDYDWETVAPGRAHTISLKTDGSLWAWGYNLSGQLGDGTRTTKITPIQIGQSYDWHDVAAGYTHSLALKKSGSFWYWGATGGSGPIVPKPFDYVLWSDTWPVDRHTIAIASTHYDGLSIQKDGRLCVCTWRRGCSSISNDQDWIAIDGGLSNGISLKSNGSLWVWDWKNNPVQVGQDYDWMAVSTGRSHNLALKQDGSLWAWGDVIGGARGRYSPMQVGPDYDWVSIAAGYGSSYALKRDGSLWAWNGNNFDQLSDGTAWETEPVQIIRPDFYTVTPTTSANGSISPNTSQSVDYGNTTSFTLTPEIGYGINTVEGCGGTLDGNTYITGAITADCMVKAGFVIKSYKVTSSAGANGGISPDSEQSVNYGNTTSFTLTPDTGYGIDTVEGCNGSLSGNVYTTGAITEDCEVTASFITAYTVIPKARRHGSLSPDTPQQVPKGHTAGFTVTPDTGYAIKRVRGCGGTLDGNTYTTGPITGKCRVRASFKKNPVVNAKARRHGSIAPAGRQSVSQGTVLNFTVTPDAGYSIKRVRGCGGTLSGNVYTTKPISRKCRVEASFRKD